ncbi:MAG: hypothetical protein WD156_08900 [Acidimicrobiia bacterium]
MSTDTTGDKRHISSSDGYDGVFAPDQMEALDEYRGRHGSAALMADHVKLIVIFTGDGTAHLRDAASHHLALAGSGSSAEAKQFLVDLAVGRLNDIAHDGDQWRETVFGIGGLICWGVEGDITGEEFVSDLADFWQDIIRPGDGHWCGPFDDEAIVVIDQYHLGGPAEAFEIRRGGTGPQVTRHRLPFSWARRSKLRKPSYGTTPTARAEP